MYIAQVSSCGLSVLNSYIGFTSCVCEYRETPPETDIRLYEDSTVAVDLKVNQYVLPPPFDVVRRLCRLVESPQISVVRFEFSILLALSESELVCECRWVID